MKRVRVIVRHNPDDPADDLRWAARVRRDLWAYSPVEIDPDSRAHGTHRDADGNAYFEFATEHYAEVQRVLREFDYPDRVRAEVIADAPGTECLNCGNISPESAFACPNCGFRDIDPCPYCDEKVARLEYLPLGGDVFRCPKCHRRVRFQFNEPMFDASGHYNQPVILVSPAEAPVRHDV